MRHERSRGRQTMPQERSWGHQTMPRERSRGRQTMPRDEFSLTGSDDLVFLEGCLGRGSLLLLPCQPRHVGYPLHGTDLSWRLP